jgi:hypothetical protein
MSNRKGNVFGQTSIIYKNYKRTSIGNGIVKLSSMNKSKRKSYKQYRGQGR